MATVSPTIGVIRALIRAIRSKLKTPNERAFGIFTPGRWSGPAVVDTGTEKINIFQCDSPLQMRMALQSAEKTDSATVLVTPLDQGKLSDDILIRLALRKLHSINNWGIVRSLFKAKTLDPRITGHAFLADMLLEEISGNEMQPVAGGLVDAETVWGILFKGRLGLSGAHPDLVELLRATAESNLASNWASCSSDFRKAAAAWMTGTAGDAATALLDCVAGEHGAKALAIGLAMGVVYYEGVGKELDKQAGRLESYIGTSVGTSNLSLDQARRWRDAAAAAVHQIPNPILRRCLDEAEVILANIGASEHAWRSNELPTGFAQRLSRFGQALTNHVNARATSISDELRCVYASVGQHRMALEKGRRMDRCEMGLRLARWLADQNRGLPATGSSLLAMARRYAAESGFVDWARQVLRGGEANKELAAAFVCLVDGVTDLREVENQKFARELAEQRMSGDAKEGLIPIEQILDQVVAKAAEKAPVLVLLLDGMSWAVFRELVADMMRHDWIEVAPEDSPKRLIGLTALPSITEVCRTSLLCGSLRRGKASDEGQGFSTHTALGAASQSGFAPKLFHKAALEGDEDSSLAGDIRSALAEKRQRVVGIVVNAVDDHLDKGDQIDPVWTMEHIRVLKPILAEAEASGRIVVLLSDHGHIIDRQTACREATDGLRWRRPGRSVANDELEITAPRVLLPEAGSVIVPWSERLRYGPKKNGYHGGATPQEMLVPISILWSEQNLPKGFVDVPPDAPAWWIEPMVTSPTVDVVETPQVRKVKLEAPTLFDAEKPVPAAESQHEPWIRSLLKCEVFACQKTLVGRAPIDEKILQRLLMALSSRGGSMTTPALAIAIGMAEHRLSGLIAVLQRLLNVEGYAILDRQDAANTVSLNVALLKKQFDLSL